MEPTPSERPRLGSLAQAARGKQLNQARTILLVVGILTIALNAFLLATLRDQVKQEIDKEEQKLRSQGMIVDPAQRKQVEDQAVTIGTAIVGATMALGAVFVVFGFIIKQFPVPITILSLVLYVGATVVFAVLNPASLLGGAIFKIIIVVALAKAIQAAVAYEKERSKTAEEGLEPGYE